MALDATRKIIASTPQLSEALLLEFSEFLSVVGEKVIISKTRYNSFMRYVSDQGAFCCSTAN